MVEVLTTQKEDEAAKDIISFIYRWGSLDTGFHRLKNQPRVLKSIISDILRDEQNI